MEQKKYDLIIIGTGSAGLPAGMYASRYKLKNLIIGKMPGGALAMSHRVENYPGFIGNPGREIMNQFKEQAINAGSEIIYKEVNGISKKENGEFLIKTSDGNEYLSNSVIVATGNSYKKLGIETENKFLGKGVSYCATCDGMFYKNLDVVIVGGGNTAITEALYLSEICNTVNIIHRKDTFRAENSWIEQAKQRKNINFVLNDEVIEIVGDNLGMNGVKLKSGKFIPSSGIFIAIGSNPNTDVINGLDVEKDEEGCIIVDERQETNIKGLYAAGDITTNSNKFKQTIMSAAEGCLAAHSVHEDKIK